MPERRLRTLARPKGVVGCRRRGGWRRGPGSSRDRARLRAVVPTRWLCQRRRASRRRGRARVHGGDRRRSRADLADRRVSRPQAGRAQHGRDRLSSAARRRRSAQLWLRNAGGQGLSSGLAAGAGISEPSTRPRRVSQVPGVGGGSLTPTRRRSGSAWKAAITSASAIATTAHEVKPAASPLFFTTGPKTSGPAARPKKRIVPYIPIVTPRVDAADRSPNTTPIATYTVAMKGVAAMS